MKNNDYEYIKNKFDNDNITAPESIKADELIERCAPLKLRRKKSVAKPLISAVACLAILVSVLYTASPIGQDRVVSGDIQTFNSYDEVEEHINRHQRNDSSHGMMYGASFGTIKGSSTVDAMNATSMDNAESAVSKNPGHATTFTQVENVDEADIIKNDGKYIYYINSDAKLMIYDGTRLICDKIKFDPDKESVREMYIDGTTLIIECEKYRPQEQATTNEQTKANGDVTFTIIDCCFVPRSDSYTYVYDLSDIKHPVLEHTFSQDGNYSTSRKIGSKLYVVTEKYNITTDIKEDCRINVSCDGKKSEVSPRNIAYTKGSGNDDDSYVIVSEYDVQTGKVIGDTKAVMGYSGSIYCSQDNLYLTCPDYAQSNTDIIKLKLKGNGIRLAGKTRVKGTVNDQYSMDESDGYFRIGTTTDKVNYVYTINEDMKVVGKSDPFGKDEDIKAMYFLGNYAYVITYELTDPLFIIDMSNPTKPVIKGSVKISGFSSQLVPVDDDTLMGIGYDDDNDEGGIKIALFDISNPEKPSVVDSMVMKYCDSNAQITHKAIVTNKDAGYYAIDYYRYDDFNSTGAITFAADENGIKMLNKYEARSGNNDTDYGIATRCTYIGDSLYVLDDMGKIAEFKIK